VHKKLFGYARRDSMSGIILDLGLPTADTIVHNYRVLFASHCLLSCSQSDRSVVCCYCCVVILFSIVFSILTCFKLLLFYELKR